MQTITLTPQQAATMLGGQAQQQNQPKPASVCAKVFAVLSVIASCIAVILFWVATGLGDVGAGGTIGIMVVPTASIVLPCVFILLSIFRLKTNYGFSITALIFSILMTIGGFCIFITFAIIAGAECDSYSYYGYGYYYYSSYSTQYCAIWSVTTIGGLLLMASQISILVLSSLEIRRVPKTPNQQIIVVQSPGVYPVQGQQVVYTQNGQPIQMVSYPQPPAYSAQPMVAQTIITNGQPQVV